MKKSAFVLYVLLVMGIALAMAISVIGCKKNEGGGPDNSINDVLFPLAAGNKINFSGWLTDSTGFASGFKNGTGNKIPNSDIGFKSSFTVKAASDQSLGSIGTLALAVGAQFVVLDTTVAGGKTTVTPLYMRFSASNPKDLQVVQNISSLYKSFGKAASALTDTLRWFDFVDASVGLGGTYWAFNDSILIPGTSSYAHLYVKGTIDNARMDWTLNGTGFSQTYHVSIKQQVFIGTSPANVESLAFELYLAGNVGPVIVNIPWAGATSPGLYRQFLSKNF